MQAYQYRGKFYTIKRNAYNEWICVELNRSTRLWRALKVLIHLHRDREIEAEMVTYAHQYGAKQPNEFSRAWDDVFAKFGTLTAENIEEAEAYRLTRVEFHKSK